MPRKRGDIWYARIQIDGRRVEKSCGPGARRKDALQLEAAYQRHAVDGKLGRKPTRTIEAALVKWLEGEASRLKSYRNIVGKVAQIEPYATGVPLTQIADAADAIKTDAIKLGLAAATVNRRLAILRRVANLAYAEWGWLDQPLGQRIKLLPGEKRRDVFLTPTEARKLANACEHPRVTDAIRLALMSGMREGELLGLTAESRRDGCLVLGSDTKNGRPRIVPLPTEAQSIELPLDISYSTLRTYFERARVVAGLPAVRFHDLRHTYASWFLSQPGASLKALSLILGHSTIAITADIYGHMETDQLRAGVEGMGRLLSGAKKGQDKRKPAQ